MKRKLPRRDLCHITGGRAQKLKPCEAESAWYSLADKLQDMGEKDVPKFADLLSAIRTATIKGRRVGNLC